MLPTDEAKTRTSISVPAGVLVPIPNSSTAYRYNWLFVNSGTKGVFITKVANLNPDQAYRSIDSGSSNQFFATGQLYAWSLEGTTIEAVLPDGGETLAEVVMPYLPVPIKGEPGATPNVQIGEVATVAAGNPAKATMGGTALNPKINLELPKGDKGDAGPGALKLEGVNLAIPAVLLGATSPGQTYDVDGAAAGMGVVVTFREKTSLAPLTSGFVSAAGKVTVYLSALVAIAAVAGGKTIDIRVVR